MGIKKIIDLKNIFHAFGSRVLFNNVNIWIERGSFVFLTGDSGSGKTTLLKILHGEISPLSGYVSIAGINFGPRNKGFMHNLRRKVTMIHQDFILLEDRSVEDNIVLPLRAMGISKTQRQKRLDIILRTLELTKIRKNRCNSLSGGEKQRVAIARAIIVNPLILLADEPTGNLDNRQTIRLIKILRHFNLHGTTIVFATHNPELKRHVENSRLIHIINSKIQEIG